MPDYLSGGDSTQVHGLTAPERYDDFASKYWTLMEALDEGMMIVVQSAGDLTAFEGGSHDDVLALVKDEKDFYVSSGGTFNSMDMIVDIHNLTSSEKNSLVDQLDDRFLLLSGGTMQGDINMDGNNINNASTVEAQDEMILPVK